MKESYYFSHDSNARNDEKILMLRAEHGWEGYGIFWVLIEMMFENSDTCLQLSKIKGIAVSYSIDITLLQNVINTCITEGLFKTDSDKFWSESLLNRKQKYFDSKVKRSEAGKKGMQNRWASDNNVITTDNNVITKDNKGKEKKVKEIKEIDNRFILGLNEIFKRRPETKWSDREIAAFKKIKFNDEDFDLVIKFYKSGYEYLRKDLLQLLNNWNGEIDKARNNTKPEQKKPYSPIFDFEAQ